MRLLPLLLLAVPLTLSAQTHQGSTQQGPFGIHMGMSVSQLTSLGGRLIEDFGYKLVNPPVPHSNFVNYIVTATPQHGACKITAISRDIIADSHGRAVRRAYEQLLAALTEKYGPPSQSVDTLKAGSTWKEPRDFIMGLRHEERFLAAFRTDSTSLPDGIRAILVEAKAYRSDVGYVVVGYEFANFKDCRATALKQHNRGL
jgi:hypothetical protein